MIRQFCRDESGATLIFWAVSLAMIVGFVALSWDLGRLSASQSEMQSFSDQVALAAAGELDGGPDAITRANAAANTLVTRQQSFADGGGTLGGADVTLTFYPDLPADDTAALTGATVDPAAARYVEATVTPRTLQFPFYRAFTAISGNAGADTTQVGATAVAGFTSFACDVTPMFFCLPDPGYRAADNIGDTILLRSQGGGTAWGPGDYGFLDLNSIPQDPNGVCSGLNGANLYRCLVAAEGPITQCYSLRGVDLEPGQRIGLADAAYNTKFDIFRASMNGARNDPLYPPAPNTISGVGRNGAGCVAGSTTPTTSKEVPPDDCFASGTCSGNNRFGDGDWSTGRADYVAANYGGTDPHPGAATRWEYYQAEIAAAGGASSTTPILDQTAYPTITERGRPQCSPHQSDDIYRRTFVTAGVDCTANTVRGSERNVPVLEFFELFMLSPARTNGASPPSVDIYAEIIGSASTGAGTDGLFHDFVQLYR
jgi:hypothetical protein